MLTEEFIAESKKKLLEEKARLEKDVSGLKTVDFGHDMRDDEERASESEQLGDNESVAEEYEARLADIESALDKIAQGTYGKCGKCQGPISEKILKIDPESRLCEKCK